MNEALACAAAYLIGAIPFGVLVARAKGVNIFAEGSGNCGATNVGRVIGRPYGVLVFVLDFLKGAGPAAAVVYWRGSVDWTAVAVGLLAFVGHIFPVYLRFRGGKGVATGAGVVAVLLPIPFALAALAFVATILASSIMSVASIHAVTVLALAEISLSITHPGPALLLAIVVCTFVLGKHKANLIRLQNGTEPRLRSLVRHRKWATGLHVLALGLWCGASVFFTFGVTPTLFSSMKALVVDPPVWLPLQAGSDELGSYLAGAAAAPMFPPYYALSAVCAALVSGTITGWVIPLYRGHHRWRVRFIWLATLCIMGGWICVQAMADVRPKRFDPDPVVHASARRSFSIVHGVSMAANLGAILCLVPALALAGYLPRDDEFTP